MKHGCVAWLTGLSGAGKSVIATLTASMLRDQGLSVDILDGDTVRQRRHAHLGFSPADIRENNRLVVGLCSEARERHDVVLVPVISPFRDSRAAAREAFGTGFFEVYVKASLAEVTRRDTKGLYRQAREGRLSGLIGVDPAVPYEPPDTPALTLDTERVDETGCATELVRFILDQRHSPSCS